MLLIEIVNCVSVTGTLAFQTPRSSKSRVSYKSLKYKLLAPAFMRQESGFNPFPAPK